MISASPHSAAPSAPSGPAFPSGISRRPHSWLRWVPWSALPQAACSPVGLSDAAGNQQQRCIRVMRRCCIAYSPGRAYVLTTSLKPLPRILTILMAGSASRNLRRSASLAAGLKGKRRPARKLNYCKRTRLWFVHNRQNFVSAD